MSLTKKQVAALLVVVLAIVGTIIGVVIGTGGGGDEKSSSSKDQTPPMEEPTFNSLILNSSDASSLQYAADMSGISIQTADGNNMTYADMQSTLSQMVDEAMKEMSTMTDEELERMVEENEANGGGSGNGRALGTYSRSLEQRELIGGLAATAAVVGIAAGLITIGNAVSGWVTSAIEGETQRREAFTMGLVDECRRNYPDYTCIAINADFAEDVIASTDIYARSHHYIQLDCCRGQSYKLYAFQNFKDFQLTRHGDGGYQNWALNGFFNRDPESVVRNSDTFRGARVFEHEFAGGLVWYLGGPNYWYNPDLFGNDAITSLVLDSGCCMYVYEHSDLQGVSQTFCDGYFPNIGDYGWNDVISSAIVQCN